MIKIIPIISLLLLTGCLGETLATFGPVKITASDVVTTPINVKKTIDKSKKK